METERESEKDVTYLYQVSKARLTELALYRTTSLSHIYHLLSFFLADTVETGA
jgi:hypothetical protein